MPRSDTTQSSDIGNGWRLIPHENSVSLYVPGRVSLIHCRTALVLPDGAKLDPTAAEVTNTPARIQVVFSYEKKISVLHNIGSGPCDGFIHITTQLTNKGEEDLPLDSMRILESQTIEAIPTLDRVLAHGTTMASFAGLQPLGPHFNSHTVIGLTNQRGAGALVLGFLKPDDAMYEAHAQTGPLAVLGLSGVVRREGIALNAGRTLEPSPYCLGWGDELAALMDAYARESGRAMNAITPAGPEDTMTGWCSWYRYYGFETQEAILENTRILAESPLRKHIKVIQIDDGWNLPEPGVPRHWGDWTPGAKFPQGMKHVADEIHSLDFKAGLWLAPFSVAPESNLAQDHADWLLQKSEKRSDLDVFVNPGGIYGLDLTHPEVLSFLKETFHRVFHEWGYDYIKIDFLGHSMAETRRYDPTKTSAQAFRMGLGAIRDAAGPGKFILCCGSPLAPAVGLCDAMRIGMDVSSRWYIPFMLEGWPAGNCNVRACMFATTWRHWMHGHWWQNDPDCIMGREKAVQEDIDAMARHKFTSLLHDYNFGLTDTEASAWAQMVWLTGTMALLSENWSELSPKRQDMVASCFPPNARPVRWVDSYTDPEVALLRTTDEEPLIVGLFNMGEESREIALPAGKLGIDGAWSFQERLSGETFAGKGDSVSFPQLPPRGGRVWILSKP